MLFTNEVLEKMENKFHFNTKISNYFYKLSVDEKMRNKTYLNLSNRVKDCMSMWKWNIYSKSSLKMEFSCYDGLMDLLKVNRCKNRFCSNCRTLDLSRALNNLKPVYNDLVNGKGAYTYILTLTVPNCKGDEISNVLTKMQKTFRRLYELYSTDNERHKLKGRIITFVGGIRCVEITYNSETNTYHPHFHILIISFDYNPLDFDKKYKGEWSNKRQKYNMYSDMDMQIRRVWSCLYQDIKLSDIGNLGELLICDIREMDNAGVYEVLKYVFKDTDILNYNVFNNMYFGLYNKRIRQGYGCFFNVKLENETEGQEQDLFEYLEQIKELPRELVTPTLEILINQYSNYIKISRFNKHESIDKLE